MTARVIVRRENGTEVDVTDQAAALWPLLDSAIAFGELDLDDVERALAIGMLAGFPTDDLEAHKREQIVELNRRAEVERERLARLAHLETAVEVTLAHSTRLDRPDSDVITPAGTAVTVPLHVAERLHRSARILRPNRFTEGGR